MSQATLWTIGYESCGFDAFLETLKAAGVATVVDVRDLPLSRRAGFSKNVLASSLRRAGLDYIHMKSLGTPKEGRLAARRGDYPLFWSIVERRMQTPEAEFDVQRLAQIALDHPTALVCFEADPEKCHRRRIADALVEVHGFAVRHLMVQL